MNGSRVICDSGQWVGKIQSIPPKKSYISSVITFVFDKILYNEELNDMRKINCFRKSAAMFK